MGVRQATYLHTKDRHRAHRDEAFLAPLKEATGIWFGGGRQWNFADSYYGTRAQCLMQDIVKRGGVAGGSSAGASVQARFLARATPIENFRILAPGYERGGLGFLSGVAIDQHFSQRNRQRDMKGSVSSRTATSTSRGKSSSSLTARRDPELLKRLVLCQALILGCDTLWPDSPSRRFFDSESRATLNRTPKP